MDSYVTSESEPVREDSSPGISPGSIFANRRFTLLLLGSSLSSVGDQFTIVALPWLVLKLTGDTTALGFVLAAMALPRAVFILIGGAIVDRISPRRVLLVADLVNAVLIGVLAVLVLSHEINMEMIYVLAVGIGLATAFAYPAGSALLPQLVQREQLQAANSLVMGIAQVCALVGPAIAGLVITFGSSAPRLSGTATSLHGIGMALSVDAVSFVFSLSALLMIRTRHDPRPAPVHPGSVLADLASGLRGVLKDAKLRAFLIYGAGASAILGGSLQVGLPVLAGTRLGMGATSLGFLMTATAVGFLIGSMLSGVVTRAIGGRIGVLVLASDCIAGASLAGLSAVSSTVGGAALLLLIGILQGTLQVAFVTWLQRRVSEELMGRTMSIVMFALTGIAPLAGMAAGALLNMISIGALFAGAGFGLSGIALFCLTRSRMREVEMGE
jgi:MFS family permease